MRCSSLSGPLPDLVRRIQFRYRPKRGSRLNVATNKLSTLTRQRLIGWLIGDRYMLQAEKVRWSKDFSTPQRGMDWRMTVDDAHRA